MDPEQVARAFSGHRFEEALLYLADDIVWTLVGETELTGSQAVAEACRSMAAELADIETVFHQFDVVVGALRGDGTDAVVVDSVADYVDKLGDTSTVASCDLYSFADGKLAAIRSYTVELE
jgi:ketosteroid isomerase-like protein